jgi:hypothetical protein
VKISKESPEKMFEYKLTGNLKYSSSKEEEVEELVAVS